MTLNFPNSPTNGQVYEGYQWDSTKGAWVAAGGTEILASTAVAGIVELATDAETQAGTDSTRVITPAGLASVIPLSVADVAALPSAANFREGTRIHVDALNVDFVDVDGVWKQAAAAHVATTTDRNTEYAKASSAYLVQGARVFVSAVGGEYVYTGTKWLLTSDVLLDAGDFSTTTLTFDGLSTEFTGFRFEFSGRGSATSGASALVFRTSGGSPSDVTGNYSRTETLARNGAVTTTTLSAQSTAVFGGMQNVDTQHVIELEGLTQAVRTIFMTRGQTMANPGAQNTSNGNYLNTFTHSQATAYGGFKITFNAAYTGTYRLYGKQ